MGLRWIKIALALGLISLVALWSARRAYTQRQSRPYWHAPGMR